MVLIDKIGISLNPKKYLMERIEWKNIEGFSECKVRNIVFAMILVNNPDYWVGKEKNIIKKYFMRYNMRLCGSPFYINSGCMKIKNPEVIEINHSEVMKMLNESMKKYKPMQNYHSS